MGDDWGLFGGNPAPGHPEAIRFVAKEVEHTASMAHEARIALVGVGSDLSVCGWEGSAAQAFNKAFAEIPPDLGLMAESYEKVGSALYRYADHLEHVQASVEHALTRARLARQRELVAEPQRAAAAKRVSDLNRQLVLVKADEKAKAVAASAAAVLPDPHAAVAANQSLQRVRVTKVAVQNALWSAQGEEASAQRELDSAAADLRAARAWAGDLAAERLAAERVAAATIEDALSTALRNKSNFELAASWVDRQIDSLMADVDALWHGNWVPIVLRIREVVKALQLVVAVLAVIALLVTFFVMPLALGPLLLWVSLGLATARFATGAALFTRKDKDGKRLVSGGELTSDGVSVALSIIAVKLPPAGADRMGGLFRVGSGPRGLAYVQDPRLFLKDPESEFGLVKRLRFSDGRTATGFLRTAHIAHMSKYRAGWELFDQGKRAHDAAFDSEDPLHRAGKFTVDQVRDRLNGGVAMPAVGPCYAEEKR